MNPDPYKLATYDRRYAGTFLIDGKDSAVTLRCCHCGGHWIPVKGSGRKRGFCCRCMGFCCGPTCPALAYGTCVPHDVYLLFLEGKVTSVPIIGAVEAAPPTG
jgi:hypothetical protein